MHIELSEDELALVIALLREQALSLPHEIHHTKSHDYRLLLRERRELVENLLGRLEAGVIA